MGVVYKARDLLSIASWRSISSPEIVASPDKILRFEAEARAISALNHPNIAPSTPWMRTTDGAFWSSNSRRRHTARAHPQIPRL